MVRKAACSVVLAHIAGAAVASAGVIGFHQLDSAINGDTGVAFSGTLGYTQTGVNTGSLVISITNTTSGLGGMITGIAFNADAPVTSATLSSTTYSDFKGVSNVNAQPFGMSFLAGAAVGANWQGGGKPSGGIGEGGTGVFVFDILSANAGSLTSSSFLGGSSDYNDVVRYRGLDNGGSAKAPAILASTPGAVIPAPAIAGPMLGLCLLGTRRRR